MIDDNLLSHCRAIAGQIAPELSKRPLYVHDAELFRGLDLPNDGCDGICFDGRITHFAYRERIPDWTTPGPLIVLFGDRIAEGVNGGDESAFRDAVYDTFLHELGHTLPIAADIPDSDGADIFDCKLVRDWQANKRQEADAVFKPLPDANDNPHNAEFLRIVIHLLGRARLGGWSMSGMHLLGGDLWHIPQSAHWALILLREVVEMAGEPFSVIVKTPPPQEFTDLWASCLNFRVRRNNLCMETTQ